MKLEMGHPAKSSPDKALRAVARDEPPEATRDLTNSARTCRELENCGDCEPGGFGMTFGFSPR